MPSNLTDAELLEILLQLPSVEKPAFDERLEDIEPRETTYNFDAVKFPLPKAKYPTYAAADARIRELIPVRKLGKLLRMFETVTYWVFEFEQ